MPRYSNNATAVAATPAPDAEPSNGKTPDLRKKGLGETTRLPELDRVIHEQVRLGIVSALAAHDKVTFNDLKKVLNTTDGNLSVHARKLEEAGYVECIKSFEGRFPKTEFRLTDSGRKALSDYLNHLETLIRVARGGGSKTAK
jgi:DNA-binding MarR family transcriptional regulator